jgi:chromosome condensin MukBEF complex kleisin-like MukF subunit
MRKNIGTIDLDTGEILAGTPVWIGVKRSNPYGSRFFMANQDALLEMARDPELTLEPKNVLLYLFSRLDFENYIQVPQVEIADDLEMPKQNVNRAINLLVKKRILIRGPKVGRSSCYRLNPDYGWKGKVHHLRRNHKTGGLEVVGGTNHRDPNTIDMFSGCAGTKKDGQ